MAQSRPRETVVPNLRDEANVQAHTAQATDWQAYGKTGDQLPALVKRALKYVPKEAQLESDQVVALENVGAYMTGYLKQSGYSSEVAREIAADLDSLADFVIDQQFPLFVGNFSNLQKAWDKGGLFATDAARVLASQLWHEWQHVIRRADEAQALEAHVALLQQWRKNKELSAAADRYIEAKQKQLAEERAKASLAIAPR